MSDSAENPRRVRSLTPAESLAPEPRGPHKSTLPPPEWTAPASVSALALERWVKGHSTARYSGPKADLGELRARLRQAVEKGDGEQEHALSKQLCRALVAQGAELDSAMSLARRALDLQDDAELRGELAGWYAGLGEMALAAATLKPLCDVLQGAAGAKALTRMAVLLARGGDASGAAQALQGAAERDPEDAIALELLAALSNWAPQVIERAQAAEIYLQAAMRRDSKLDRAGAYEDVLRAFDAAPEAAHAAELLSEALIARGRGMAADEVLRQHGNALEDAAGKAVHERRFRKALADRDWSRALAAAFDAGLDTTLALEPVLVVVQKLIAGEPIGEVTDFDSLLAEVGLLEALSSRLELCALRAPRARRGELLGYLASLRASRSLSPGSQEADDAVRIARAQLVEGDAIAAMTTLAQALPADVETGRAAGLLWSIAAEQGAASARAGALSLLARLCEGSISSLLYTASAAAYLAASERPNALQVAEAACHAEPGSARALSLYAEASFGSALRVTALSIERAMALGVPRSYLCRELAQVLERLDEPGSALGWTQRWLALAPGDEQAARALLQRATAAQDGRRLVDALTWLLAQPQPRSGLVEEIVRALRTLARIDSGLCHGAARRVLDTFGPRVDAVRAAVLEVADWLGERRLAIAVIERQLVSGVSGPHRAEYLLELCRLRREGGDANGAARALVRALAEGASASTVAAALQEPLAVTSGDGQIALAQLRAELATLDSTTPPEQTAAALRAYGATLWDLASDQQEAYALWERAALLDRRRGLEQYSRDLTAFAGPALARQKMLELAGRCADKGDAARLLVLVAGLAIDAGDRKAAFDLAKRALEMDPRRADALATAERAAGHEDLPELERVYAAALASQLGCYGVRGLSYRAARKLERLGDHPAALDYAVRAFEAVPADGVTLMLMLRLAEQQGNLAQAVESLEGVAIRFGGTSAGEHWKQKAAEVASKAGGGERQRVEQAQAALLQAPSVEGVRTLCTAIGEWVAKVPDERDAARELFVSTTNDVLSTLQAPSDAEVALALAMASLESYPGLELAVQAANTALGLNPAEGDFALLLRHVPQLAAIPQSADLARWCVECIADRRVAVAAELLDLSLQLFAAHGDEQGAARALSAASQRDPANVELYRRAATATWATGNVELVRLLDGVIPGVRGSHLVRVAHGAATRGDDQVAISLLEPAWRAALLPADSLREVSNELAELYRRTSQAAQLIELLERDLTAMGPEHVGFVERVLELARLHVAANQSERALDALRGALARSPNSNALFAEAIKVAQQLGNTQAQRELLALPIALEAEAPVRSQRLRDLAALAQAAGDAQSARQAWQRLLEVDQTDGAALAALTRDAEEREDWPAAAELLSRAQAATQNADLARELGRKRAHILEHRLQRVTEAKTVLEDLLGTLGEDLAVLQALAELCNTIGERERAAPLWERASRLAPDRAAKEDLLLRASSAYVELGDDKNARQILAQTGPLSGNLSAAQLKVAVEKRSGDALTHARALEELAAISPDSADERAHLLIDAAKICLEAGRFDVALGIAERATRLAPNVGRAQLLARLLAMRQGSSGREQALAAAGELRALAGSLNADDDVLRRLLNEVLATSEASARSLLPRSDVVISVAPPTTQSAGIDPGPPPAPSADVSLPPRRDPGAQGPRTLLFGVKRRPSGSIEVAPAPANASRPRPVISVGSPPAPPSLPAGSLSPQPSSEESLPLLRPSRRSSDVRTTPMSSTPAAPEPPGVEATVAQATAAPAAEPRSPAEGAPESSRPISALPPSAVPVVAVPVPAVPAPPIVPNWPPRSPTPPPVRVTRSETELQAAVAQGNMDAGRELVQLLRQQPDRSRDLVRVCRYLCDAVPGDASLLALLYDAASRDGDHVYARAIEHALGVLQAMPDLEPPPLAEQVEQPDEVAQLLFHPCRTPAGDVLGLIWQWGGALFWQEPAKYGVTGLERLAPNAPTALGQACHGVTRALGLLRTPIFHKRSDHALRITPAPLNPPALVLEGDVPEVNGELCYWLGVALCATLPEQVLLATMPAEQVEDILRAVGAAFGPPHSSRAGLAGVAQLAGALWERIPAREQRRLSALCFEPGALDRELAVAGAQQAARRAGLFVSGDLLYALGALLVEEGIDPAQLGPAGFHDLCLRRPEAADLLRLATSPEYAAARWQHPKRHTSRPTFQAV